MTLVRRIKVGPVGGLHGLYMSKPGVDVETASAANMAFSPDINFFQVVYERRITFTQVSRGSAVRVVRRIDHPNFGYIPLMTIDNNSRSFNFGGDSRIWNLVSNPVARYPFGQTSTGFWLARHTINAYPLGYITPGGEVTIRLYDIATATAGYALPAYDVLEPDA